MGDALVNHAGFFAPGDDLDREAQNLIGFLQEGIPIAGFAQGLCGHSSDLVLSKACQTFCKTRQAVPAALHGVQRQIALGIQAIALSDSLFEVLGAVDLSVVEAANFKAKAVRAQVNGSEEGTVLHKKGFNSSTQKQRIFPAYVF